MNRQLSGVIDYVGDEAGVRGRETWQLTVHADGARSVGAHCRTWDSGIDRRVVHTVTASFLPVRTFVTQHIAGRFAGEGWFRFGDPDIESVVLDEGAARRDLALTVSRQVRFFVPHVVCCDAWIVPSYDLARGGAQELAGGWRSSPLPDGGSDPVAVEIPAMTATLVGEERVRVPAGTFSTWHFVLEQPDGQTDEVWTTTDGDWLLVQLRCDALRSWYRLTQLTETHVSQEAAQGRSG